MRMVCETPSWVRLLSKIGAPNATRTRSMSAMSTGAPTTSIMKIVRRDQSISLSERSKIRRPDAMKPGAAGIGRGVVSVMCCCLSLCDEAAEATERAEVCYHRVSRDPSGFLSANSADSVVNGLRSIRTLRYLYFTKY